MKKSLLFIPLLALLLQGCGVTIKRYEPAPDNVQLLKQMLPLESVTPPQVTAAAGQGSIWVRTHPIKSPSGSLALHIQDALTEELRLADLLNPNAQSHLQVLVTRNEVDAGIINSTGRLAARITLLKGTEVLYDRITEVNRKWRSHVIPTITLLKAANAYNPMVHDLLKALYSDPQFIQALRKS